MRTVKNHAQINSGPNLRAWTAQDRAEDSPFGAQTTSLGVNNQTDREIASAYPTDGFESSSLAQKRLAESILQGSDEFFLPKYDYIPSPYAHEVQLSEARVMIGHQGPLVKDVQRGLNRANAMLAVDGKYGLQTHLAVRAFQRKHKLVETGRVDKNVLKLLHN